MKCECGSNKWDGITSMDPQARRVIQLVCKQCQRRKEGIFIEF